MAKKQPNPYLDTESPDDLAPAQRLAHDIVAERRDLLPSVERIINAELGDATLDALSLFQNALATPGDPCRDPAVAVARASGKA